MIEILTTIALLLSALVVLGSIWVSTYSFISGMWELYHEDKDKK